MSAAAIAKTGTKPTDRAVDPDHRFLSDRGISPNTAQHFGVGVYEGPGLAGNRLLVPICNERGQHMGHAERSISSSTEPHYQFLFDREDCQTLFNCHQAAYYMRASCTDEVIVVADFLDCLKVHQAGFPNVVALGDRELTGWQEGLLRSLPDLTHVSVFMDRDQKGSSSALDLANRLFWDLYVTVVWPPADAAKKIYVHELNDSEINELLVGKGHSIPKEMPEQMRLPYIH